MKLDIEKKCDALRCWEELSRTEIDARLQRSMADIDAGNLLSQEQMDAKVREHLTRKQSF